MDMEIRSIHADEIDAYMVSVSRAFGSQPVEEMMALFRPHVAPERSLAAFHGGEIVGGAGWFPSDVVVPGGTLSMAGVSDVGVLPTHRRRGLLTRLMDRQLTEFHEMRIPLAGLFASESIIYGRFGYGIASFSEKWSIARQHTSYAERFETKGHLRFATTEEVEGIFPKIERRAIAGRVGAFPRPEADRDIMLADPELNRGGASAHFHVVYESDGRVEGFVSYRLKDETVLISTLMAVTDDAHAALWRYCFDIDLRTTTEARHRPVDDPLPWMLADPGRLKREVRNGLWLRLVDVEQALASRSYSRDGGLVLGVVDSFCPWNDGTFELEASGSEAECRRSTKSPDLVLSAADLAAGYLGAEAFSTLAHAGRVEEGKPRTLDLADAMFAHRPLPWSPFHF